MRSHRGFLLVLLAVTASASLALIPLAERGAEHHTIAYYAQHLYGLRVVGLLLGLGGIAWVVLATAEALFRRRWAVALVALTLVLCLPSAYRLWATHVWERHGWLTAFPVATGPLSGSGLAGTHWKGTAGGDCGYFIGFEVVLDTDSTGAGRALPLYADELSTLVFAVGALDGPQSQPVEARVLDGYLHLYVGGDRLYEYAAPIRLR